MEKPSSGITSRGAVANPRMALLVSSLSGKSGEGGSVDLAASARRVLLRFGDVVAITEDKQLPAMSNAGLVEVRGAEVANVVS